MNIIIVLLVGASLALALVEIARGSRDLIAIAVAVVDIALLLWLLGAFK